MAQSMSNILGNRKTPSQIIGGTNVSPAMQKVGSQYQINKVTGGMERKNAPLAFPALGALGVTPQSGNSLIGSRGTTGTTPPANGTSNAGAALSSRDQQLNSIQSQAQGIQSILNQRSANESASNTNQNTSTGNTRGLFSDVLGSLVKASDPTKEQNRVRKEMERVAAGNKAIADEAKRTSDMYAAEIARVGNLGAGAVAGNLSTGTQVVGSGNANLASMSASQRMQALSDAQQAALKGTEQQLTAQEQTAQAMRPSLEAALTQQQQQITGLGTVGGLAAPTQVQPGSTLFTPDTGQEVAAGMGGWANYTTAQQAQSLMEQYADAGIQYNPNLSPQQNLQMIQQAIGGSNTYQRGTFGVAGSDSFIGAQQLGAAGALTGQVAQLQAKGEAAKANFQGLLGIMQRGQVNNLDQPIANQIQNAIRRGLASDADVVAFEAIRNSLVAAYADVLSGGNPTNEYLAIAESKLPKDVSLKTLTALEKEISNYYNNLVAGMNQAIGSYSGGSGMGGGFSGGGGMSWDDI